VCLSQCACDVVVSVQLNPMFDEDYVRSLVAEVGSSRMRLLRSTDDGMSSVDHAFCYCGDAALSSSTNETDSDMKMLTH
jgi:hypothetical protein